MSNITLYGAVGYSILLNKNNNNYIIIFSDNHSKLNKCDKYIDISKWLKKKFFLQKCRDYFFVSILLLFLRHFCNIFATFSFYFYGIFLTILRHFPNIFATFL